MGMKMKGDVKSLNGFERMKRNLPKEIGLGVEKCTRLLYRQSQIEVPKDTLALQNTAHFVEIKTSGNVRSRAVRYGEPGEGEGIIDYAAAVHEILSANHASPTKAKYVEGPLIQQVPEYERIIGESAQNAVRRSFR